MQKAVQAVAGVLCIADLLDICPQRFVVPNDEWLSRIAPVAEPELLRSVEHFVGHNVVDVDVARGEAVVHRPDQTATGSALARIVAHTGPLRDLLHWGNQSQLRRALRDAAGLSEWKGISPVIGMIRSTNGTRSRGAWPRSLCRRPAGSRRLGRRRKGCTR